DLELDASLQRDIPPLRDAFQTAALFATQLVMRTEGLSKTYADVLRIRCKAVATYGLPCSSFDNTPSVRSWFAPLVFEIGRTHAIRRQQSFAPPAPAASDCYGWKTLGCLEIQPGAETTHASIPANLSTRAALATGLTVALLGLLLIHGAKPKQPQTSRQV